MKRVLVVLTMLVMAAAVCGCVAERNPETGVTEYVVPTETIEKVNVLTDSIDALAIPVTSGVSAVNQGAGVAVGAVFGVLGMLTGAWRKWRTPLIETKTTLGMVSLGARAGADVIDEYVKNTPEWPAAKKELKAAERIGAIMPDKV